MEYLQCSVRSCPHTPAQVQAFEVLALAREEHESRITEIGAPTDVEPCKVRAPMRQSVQGPVAEPKASAKIQLA
jgi:hypothetical protein